MSTTFNAASIDLIYPGEPFVPGGWQVSDWNAGQSGILRWSPDQVRVLADGSVEFALGAAPRGATRPYIGGEVQSVDVAATGTWTWLAQAPQMVDGAVFGLFTYKADWENDPWIEFDFEFVGANTTQVRLNIHMETATGEHVTLEAAKGGPVLVDLGFDASQGMHSYAVTVTATEAIFTVDGKEVGRFDASDMPYGTWTTGEMKGFVNLWAVDASLESWAGSYDGTPIVGRIGGLGYEPGDEGSADPVILGTDGNDVLVGTDRDDSLDGAGGDDTLDGAGGNDRVSGGDGNDVFRLDIGNDRLDGGLGIDTLKASGTLGVTIDLAITGAQATGQGSDTLAGIENVAGAAGTDRLSGDERSNLLEGGGGNDTLSGRGGADRLVGGAGQDSLTGGADADLFVFLAAGDSPAGQKRDTILDFRSGLDDVDLSAIDVRADLAGHQAFRFGGSTAGAWTVWTVFGRAEIILRADVTGDRTADLEVRLAGLSVLGAGDVVL